MWYLTWVLLSLIQGGMRAVLWADTIQCMIMVAGQLAIVIQGCARVGGIKRVWQIAEEGGRLNFWSYVVSERNFFVSIA